MSFSLAASRTGLALLPCALAIAQGPTLDYAPAGPEVVLNTDFTQIQPTQGPPVNVTGGLFVFRDVTINQGVRVRGQGSRPMIWVVTGSFIVHGELNVNGSDGQVVNTLNSANFPAFGGPGGPGGGNGGHGSPNSIARSARGSAGSGPGGAVGGSGGQLSCISGCGRGSGGGGGSFATQGDPWFKRLAGAGTLFQQQLGMGGQGCVGAAGAATRNLTGGFAGISPFTDARADNNFFGIAVDVFTRRSIVGELALPIGGQGGGGGGNLSSSTCVINDPNFANDNVGGGGGGGGGCLIVYSQRFIYVGPTGRITANGGNGGGGEQAGSCNQGGGGGAGSGGMIILAAEQAIALTVKGETYANNNYDFVLSADGGVCKTGQFSFPVILSKYPASGQLPQPGMNYDAAPLGGFGGMGVIQLFTRPGNNADGTNTVLDDGIILVQGNNLLLGAQKQRFLAWRGFPNAVGVPVDDSGVPTNIGSNEGDIRPTPILMPLF